MILDLTITQMVLLRSVARQHRTVLSSQLLASKRRNMDSVARNLELDIAALDDLMAKIIAEPEQAEKIEQPEYHSKPIWNPTGRIVDV